MNFNKKDAFDKGDKEGGYFEKKFITTNILRVYFRKFPLK